MSVFRRMPLRVFVSLNMLMKIRMSMGADGMLFQFDMHNVTKEKNGYKKSQDAQMTISY